MFKRSVSRGLFTSFLLSIFLTVFMGAQASALEGPGITGKISDPSGKPLSGVSITLANDENSVTGVTDQNGQFEIAAPTAGKYLVTIDVSSLPEGISIADPGPQREIVFIQGPKGLIFKTQVGTSADQIIEKRDSKVPQLIVDGLLFGLTIALGAMGLNLIFGTTGLTNFSHGELLTFGAFTAWTLNYLVGLNMLLAVPLSLMMSAFLWGWVQNRYLWKPLRRRGTGLMGMMIVSIGLALTLRYTALATFGGSPRNYNQYAAQPGLNIFGVAVTPKAIILAVIEIVVLAIVLYWLKNSKIGKATRAVRDNPDLASATGIDVERVISYVWTLGAFLAALAGITIGINQDVSWRMGQILLLIMFASVTLGGLGTIYGALIGSLTIGVLIQVSTLVIPTELKTVSALFVMILMLLFRPQGILGKRERVG
ncbi:MAG: branched-chain amino acid ABC transporter permease [Actinomycetota bacterium]|nr:branched-chain amino acid ABC transporter permease [Actinomycetota bacterium]